MTLVLPVPPSPLRAAFSAAVEARAISALLVRVGAGVGAGVGGLDIDGLDVLEGHVGVQVRRMPLARVPVPDQVGDLLAVFLGDRDLVGRHVVGGAVGGGHSARDRASNDD